MPGHAHLHIAWAETTSQAFTGAFTCGSDSMLNDDTKMLDEIINVVQTGG